MSSVLERSRFVLVIGGGQAGLAAGYWLKRQDIPFLIVEGSARIGDVWRQRYASLSLFTTRAFSACQAWPGGRRAGLCRDEFADYLEAYARRFALPIRLSTSVQRLRAGPQGVSWPICRTAARWPPRMSSLRRAAFRRRWCQRSRAASALRFRSGPRSASAPASPARRTGAGGGRRGQRPRPGRAGLGLASGDAGHGQAAQAGARARAGSIDLVVAAQPGADARVVRVIHRQGIAAQGPLSRS